MNKQEQIEEMAVIGCVRTPQAYTAEECAKCGFKNGRCNAYRHAEALYNAGYRKIPEDSVVLSREEYEMLANQYKNLEIKYSNLCDNYRLCKDANETLKQNIIIIRKETAEKIFTELLKEKQLIDLGCGDGTYEYIDVDDLEDLAKQYGVEIKE